MLTTESTKAYNAPNNVAALITYAQLPTPTPIGSAIKDAEGFDMIYIPSGEFRMGIQTETLLKVCTDILKAGNEERCKTLTEIIRNEMGLSFRGSIPVPSFWMDRYEVTIEEYSACIKSEGPRPCQKIVISGGPNLDNDPSKPQVGVNWYDAEYFCNRRGSRLPTEIEWEYAARGSANLIFPWGNEFNRNFISSPQSGTYAVGTIPQNQSWVGIFDLSGNAAEWVEDRFLPYSTTGRSSIPIDDISRVIRGGSWATTNIELTTFARQSGYPKDADYTVGFRCVRSTDPRT